MLLDISHFNLWVRTETSDGKRIDSQLLHDINLQIAKNQTLALVGESGSGKSVTALSVLRLLEESSTIRTQGSILFENSNILKLPPPEIRSIRGNKVAMIFQEPMTSLNPVYTIGNQMIEPLQLHRGMNQIDAEREAIQLLGRTGITDPETRMRSYPHQLSGGQRQRIMIAMALACRPQLLIADEPTTALDVTVQAQILALIKDLQREFEMSVLLITHDLSLVEKVADTLAIMKDGRIVESGKCSRILTQPEHPYTRHLLSSVPSDQPGPKPISPPILETRDLSCTFSINVGWVNLFKRKKRIIRAVDKITFTLHKGTTCGIVGESGSGKTTLAMAILKLVKSTGIIDFDAVDLQQLSNREMRTKRSDIQIVFQDPYSSLSPRLTVYQILEEGLVIHFPESDREDRINRVYEALEEVGLEPEMAHRYPHEFSGGQRQRIAIARVVILKPRLLILDEPTSALDVTIQAQIIELLKTLQSRYNMSYIFISHDLRVIRSISDYIVVMQNGQMVESGPAHKVFTAPEKEYTKTLFSAALEAPATAPAAS
ncbi:ABC transporter ATP-binding protein [Desulfosediminicola ganghwensis]|uniref:ABC transporter ATP-binding protein n=1 Tax=Desulfosediminicola ganghwensis TaxID=2569540 RepID=UPI0010AC7EE8|nr:dipeptide ABC transporter ATP-binding protein [Desulfosediminicola ganghwensis]